MPARRPSKRRAMRVAKAQKSRRGRSSRIIFKVLTLFLIPLILFVILMLTTKYWDGVHKLVLASESEEGIDLTVYDPSADSITDIFIPGSTEVEVAGNLGKWRLKAVSKLGEKEGNSKRLLADTITKHFRFPIYNAELGLGDKIRVYIYNLTLKNYKRERIDLSDTKYLKRTTLSDGEAGYVVSGKIPADIAAIFSDSSLTGSLVRTKIVDRSGGNLGERIGEIVEVLGLKVISVSDEEVADGGCRVSGKNSEAIDVAARLFGCTKGDESTDFDVSIVLGKGFGKRF